MRPFLLVLVVFAVAACLAAGAGSARVDSPNAQRVLLQTNDLFGIAGTHVTCRVTRRAANFANRLLCFRATAPLGNRAPVKSYAVDLGEAGVKVIRVGTRRPVFERPEIAPAGRPVGSAGAPAALGRRIQLKAHTDKAFVAGTNIVCRPFGTAPKLSVLCVLIGSDNHIHDGTLLVLLSDHGLVVAAARNGKPVTVFERVHGR
ncbi:MAG: hypothetical protein ACJ77E_11520 [Gaiellaceae bacterium]